MKLIRPHIAKDAAGYLTYNWSYKDLWLYFVKLSQGSIDGSVGFTRNFECATYNNYMGRNLIKEDVHEHNGITRIVKSATLCV